LKHEEGNKRKVKAEMKKKTKNMDEKKEEKINKEV
jgi:hypothetical protein